MSSLSFTPEQQVVIDSWGKGQAVIAGAGAGKTTTLVAKCLQLIENQPDARFAAVSFTERSASDLRERLSLHFPLTQHWVMTIHGLAGAIIQEFPREAGFEGSESILPESDARIFWERSLEKLWFDDLPESVEGALQRMMNRESRTSLIQLLGRMKDLQSFGVLDRLDQNESDSQDLLLLAEYVIQFYERMKVREGVIDFSDLERGAQRALQNSMVRRSFHSRFDLVMVDEFQDTSPLQGELILNFIRPDYSNLCIVGDPKQSIYRFRDADVSVFEDFVSRMPVQQALTWNFRSRPGVIDFVNEVCQPAFKASEMKYDPLVAKRESAEQGEPVLKMNLESPEELGQWILAEQEKGVPLEDMVLLTRKIRGNESWFRALSAMGIPLAISSGGLFWEDPRVRELVSLLRWWDTPSYRLSAAQFLRAPWVGVADEWIDSQLLAKKDLGNCFLETNHPLALYLSPLKEQVIRPGELLLGLLELDGLEEQMGAAVLGLWHRAEELSAKGLSFSKIVEEFSRAMKESRVERDVPPPKNQGQLTVMTVHGSKGLEYPHVILIDLQKKTRAANAPMLYWDRKKGSYLAGRDESGQRKKKDPIEKEWKDEERQKDLAESKRLFYVALTRAQERLILACLPLSERDERDAGDEKVYTTDFWRGWMECPQPHWSVLDRTEWSGSVSESLAQNPKAFLEYTAEKAPPKEWGELKRARHSVTEWAVLNQCPRLYEWRYIRPKVIGTLESKSVSLSSSSSSLSAADLGTRVHAALETRDFEALAQLEREVGSRRLNAAKIIEWVESSEEMNLPENRTWNELAFEIPIFGEVLVGAMDRVVQTDEGYCMIDFKVTQKLKESQTLIETYRLQMNVYAWALGRIVPAARGKIRALLVNLAVDGVLESEVPLEKWVSESDKNGDPVPVKNWIEKVNQIIQPGQSAEPYPSSHCLQCEFNTICPDRMI